MPNAALFSSMRQDWLTPPKPLGRVRQVSRTGSIGLDPCGHPHSHVNANTTWLLARGEDGLIRSWAGHGLVFVNCPYARGVIAQWATKIAEEGRAGVEIVALLPARVDAAWFQHLWRAAAVCFWRGRIKFVGAKSAAPFPSVFVYYGEHTDTFVAAFSDSGKIWVLADAVAEEGPR